MLELQYEFESPIGKMYLTASEEGLTGVFWKKNRRIQLIRDLQKDEIQNLHLKQAIEELGDYFKGNRKSFHVKLSFKGTPFQEKVWRKLLKIPFGKVITYSELAIQIDSPNAQRAVGSANRKNPICIFIPCHRVVTKNSKKIGYSGGVEKKLKLHALEKIN